MKNKDTWKCSTCAPVILPTENNNSKKQTKIIPKPGPGQLTNLNIGSTSSVEVTELATLSSQSQTCIRSEFATSSPKITLHSPNEIDFQINIPTSNSYESLTTDDDESCNNIGGDTVTNLNSLNRSCPAKTMSVSNSETEILERKIFQLEHNLKTSDKLYRDLLIENGEMKKIIKEYEQKIDKLTRICKTTTKKAKKNYPAKPVNSSTSALEIRQPRFEEEQQIDTNFENIGDDLTLEHLQDPHASTMSLSNCTLNNKNHLNIRRKLWIIADDQGQDMQQALQTLVGDKYEVCCFWKSGAEFNDVIKTCESGIKTLTRFDFLVVLAGINDTNIFNLKNSLLKWLSSIINTKQF
ncbi:hypothetical protein O0L34_g1957 [Tuta absoluta]|nr:hypothetical protein O0L34_g1957 [Tuta absoluta]